MWKVILISHNLQILFFVESKLRKARHVETDT